MPGVSFNGIRWSFVLVCTVCDVTIGHHIHVSKPTFWRNLLTNYAYSSASPPFVLYVIALNLYYQVRISEENKLNATTQQLITAKISGCTLKQGTQTHSSLRQSNLQLQNEAALMSCPIRAVEHRNCVAGLAGTHPGLQDRILLNYTRIENAHKVRKKTIDFLLCTEAQQTFSFPFYLLRHYQMPERFYVNCSF